MRAYHPLLLLGLTLFSGCESITGVFGDDEPRFAAIYVGPIQACGLTASGDAYCWGTEYDGGFVKYPTRLQFRAMGLGTGNLCGLKAVGELYCRGVNSLDLARQFPARRFGRIARSVGHSTCALGVDGEALCWGRLYDTCDAVSCDDLRVVPTAEPLVQVAVGNWQTSGGSHDPFYGGHACGLSATGTAYCWGENGHEVGGAPITGFGFVALDTGKRDTCAIDGEGAAYCWGENFSPTPTRVTDIPFAMISAGGDEVCGLTADGDAYCWRSTSGDLRVPAKVPGGIEFVAVSVSSHEYYEELPAVACGLTSEGEAYCWSRDSAGEIGLPVRITRREKTNIIIN